MKKSHAIIAILLALALGGCAAPAQDAAPTQDSAQTQATAAPAGSGLTAQQLAGFSEADSDTAWQDESPNYITVSNGGTTFTGSGASADGGTITITAGGTYVFSGTLDDGTVVVDIAAQDDVHLVLNGVTIHSESYAPLYIKQAGNVTLTLETGTQNTLSDGESYAYADNEEVTACLFSHDDLTINGEGSLRITDACGDGITSRDDLRIVQGTLEITAADDGIMGRDLVAVSGGSITITAGGDGIKSTNDSEDEVGNIAILGGSFSITAGADGLQAAGEISIQDGTFALTTGGGSANSSDKAGWGNWGGPGGQSDKTQDIASAKGLKAGTALSISGGSFTLDCSDDTLHTNGSMVLSGGTMNLASGDDGAHADASLVISGGDITITTSYEGLESADITISGGTQNVTSRDDGVNVSGGADSSSLGGRPGQNSFTSTSDDKLTISGGSLTVNASGDGLDVNGSMYISGGTILVSGPTDNGNGALDYDGVFEITGGILVAAGSTGMAQGPSDGSTQPSMMATLPSSQAGNTRITLTDAAGQTLVTFAPAKTYQNVVISTPQMKADGTYTLLLGGQADGSGADAAVSGAQTFLTYTQNSTQTYVDETGVTQAPAGGMPQGGGPGGRGGENPGKGF